MSLRHIMRRCRIALLALLAMVLNQAAFAAHLCVEPVPADPATVSTEVEHDTALLTPACHEPLSLSDTQHNPSPGCDQHCAHAADGNQHAKLPTVAPVGDVGFSYSLYLPVSAPTPIPTTPRDAVPPLERRLVVFVSLLI